jgi:hypothetical protein
MAIPFLNNIIIDDAGHIQFKTAAGANAGKIDQDGNNLVLTNAVGDILLGDGSSDVYIGDGANNVDIIFEQSGSIKGDGSAVTLTLGGANTTLNLENPNFTGNITMSSKLKFTTTNGFILFDYEPTGDTGEYSTEVPLLKVDRSGEESTILARISEYRGIALGIDDTTWIRAGDTSSVVRSNVNLAEEIVLMSAESGFRAIGFPNNDTTWSNRQEFKFYTAGTDINLNGLYIGDAGSTQFIDLSRNLKNIGTVTASGKISGGEIEGTSLDINGTSDVSGNAVFHGKSSFGATTSNVYNVHVKGTGWAGSGIAIEATTTNGAVLSLFNTDRNFQIASRGSTLDFRDITDSDTRRFYVDSSGNLHPGADSSYNLGSNSNRWLNIYADTLYGDGSNLTGVTATDSTKLPLAGGTLTGAVTISTSGIRPLEIKNTSNGSGAGITFNDNPSGSQKGYITHFHSDSLSYGSGASIILGTTESTLTVLADGKLMYGEGIYSKPGSGTGAGTRKDQNWDTAYGWGNHASAGYLTSSGTIAQANNLQAFDDRDMAPEDLSYSDDLKLFFSAKEGLEDGTSTGSNWQDALVLNSYSDSSGAALTNNPTAPTQSAGNNSTRIATTAFVSTAVSNLIDNAPDNLNTLNELAEALNDDDDAIVTINTALGNRYTKTESDAKYLLNTTDTLTGVLTLAHSTSAGLIVKNSGNSGQDASIVIRGARNAPSAGVNPAKLVLQSYDSDAGSGTNVTGGEFYMEATSLTGGGLTDFEVGIRYRKDGSLIDGFNIHDGTFTVNGNIAATNFSGSSSGTNTGDQDISGIATNATAISGKVAKAGDTMTGDLIIDRTGDNISNISLRRDTTADNTIVGDINWLNSNAEGTDDRLGLIRLSTQGGNTLNRGGKLSFFTRVGSSSAFRENSINQFGDWTFYRHLTISTGSGAGTIKLPVGTKDLPSLTFIDNTDSGIYSTDGTSVTTTIDGTKRLNVTTGGIDVNGNITVSGTVDGIDIATLASNNTGTNTGDQDLSSYYNSEADVTQHEGALSIGYSQLTGTVPTWNQNTTGSAGSVAWGNITDKPSTFAPSSHTHDDRYYTETEMQTFFNRGYISKVEDINLAVGWYTIATNTGDRATGMFQIWDTASSDHQSVVFTASHHFGTDQSNDITVLTNSRYSGTNFRYIRIKEAGTYNGAALQVYVDATSNTVAAAIVGANAQESGWVLKDWVPDATDPGDVDNYSSFAERCKLDLDNIINGGIATTGLIYSAPSSGTATAQYRVLTQADEGSGNGIDADTLDGQHASAFQAAGSYAAASHTHAASDINSGTFDDARISASSVTQHVTSFPGFGTTSGTALEGDTVIPSGNQIIDWTTDQGSTNIHAGNYTNTTYVSSDFTHDDLTGFVANEHIDWTAADAGTIHSSNISFPSDNNTFRTVEVDSNGNDSADSTLGASETLRFKKGSNISIDESNGVIELSATNTTYSVGDGGLTQNNFTDTLKNKLDGIEAGADVNVATNLGKTTATGQITITSSTGSNVVIGEATGSIAGLMSTTHHDKLDGIASGATNVTNNNQLTNGAGYITSFDITTQTDPKYIRSNANDVVTGNTTWNDSNQARFGTGGDLKIQHNGTNSYIDNHTGNLYIRNNATSDLGKDIFIQAKSGEASIYAFDDADVELYYNNSKKFSTTSTGFECNGTEIDTSSNGGGYKIGFNVSDNFSFSGYDVAHYGISNAGNDTGGGIVLSGYFGIRFATNGSIRGHFSNTGTFTTSGDIVGFGSPSDISLKENIKPIDNALDKVCKLKGVTFDWKESDSILEIKEDIGFIAQDVQEVLPELIKENDNGKLSLRDKGIVPVLVEAIKELKAEIDELKKCNKCKNCNCNA